MKQKGDEFVVNQDSPEYEEGKVAYIHGISYESCPHAVNTQAWFDWGEGWLDEEAAEVAFEV